MVCSQFPQDIPGTSFLNLSLSVRLISIGMIVRMPDSLSICLIVASIVPDKPDQCSLILCSAEKAISTFSEHPHDMASYTISPHRVPFSIFIQRSKGTGGLSITFKAVAALYLGQVLPNLLLRILSPLSQSPDGEPIYGNLLFPCPRYSAYSMSILCNQS